MRLNARREEKVMVTSGIEGLKWTRTLLDFSFVKKRKVDEEQTEGDGGSDVFRVLLGLSVLSWQLRLH